MSQSVRSEGRSLSWPDSGRVYLTLDFECDFGTAMAENTYEALDHVGKLAALLERHDVALTTFVQTEVLDRRPETVERLRECGVSTAFHPHSHTHSPRDRTDVGWELETSTDRYRSYFGTDPTGYRFPNGNLRPRDYRKLADLGYGFDASVFPSWRPNHFNNARAPTVPQYLPEYDLLELPFTVYSNLVRIPTALSYCRLLGRPFTWLLTGRPPDTVVLNVHMHDLVTPSTVDSLSPLYRAIYSRNDAGLELLDRLLGAFERGGYTFALLDDVFGSLRDGHVQQ